METIMAIQLCDKMYVLGFAFSYNLQYVILIQKTHPEDQAGKFNGVGGELHENEAFKVGMSREFKEETGVETNPNNWMWVDYRTFRYNKIGLLTFCIVMDISECKTQTEEGIFTIPIPGGILDKMPLVNDVQELVNKSLEILR